MKQFELSCYQSLYVGLNEVILMTVYHKLVSFHFRDSHLATEGLKPL